MYQLIREDISQILLTRLFLFVGLFIVLMAAVYLSQTHAVNSYPFGESFELNKTSMLFPAFRLQ
jgi:hypothetical protein